MTSYELQENWANLLEVIFEDSTPEEIELFALRLKEIPKYTRAQEYARNWVRNGYTQRKVPDEKNPFLCSNYRKDLLRKVLIHGRSQFKECAYRYGRTPSKGNRSKA